MTDEDLVLRLLEGDERAFEMIYDRHGGGAWSLARRLLDEREVAEELVQEAFLAVWNQAGQYSSTPRHRTHVDPRDRASPRGRPPAPTRRRRPPRQNALEHIAATAQDAPDASDEAIAGITAGAVNDALGSVPNQQLQVLRLAYYGGHTHHEIAEMLSVPLGTVKSRMRLGLDRVRSILDPEVVGV